MEHRHHPRKRAAQSAFFYHPQGFVCPCRVDNISKNGLYVKTDETRLCKGSCVKLAIKALPRSTEMRTIKALVVHKGDDGMGLLLEKDVPFEELFEGLGVTSRLVSADKDIQ